MNKQLLEPIPNEIMELILSFLPLSDIVNVSQLNRNFLKYIENNEKLWKYIFETFIPTSLPNTFPYLTCNYRIACILSFLEQQEKKFKLELNASKSLFLPEKDYEERIKKIQRYLERNLYFSFLKLIFFQQRYDFVIWCILIYIFYIPLSTFIEQGDTLLRLFFLYYLRMFNEQVVGNSSNIQFALLWLYSLSVIVYVFSFLMLIFHIAIWVRKSLFGKNWDREELQKVLEETRDFYRRRDPFIQLKLERIRILKLRYYSTLKHYHTLSLVSSMYQSSTSSSFYSSFSSFVLMLIYTLPIDVYWNYIRKFISGIICMYIGLTAIELKINEKENWTQSKELLSIFPS